MSAAPHDLAAHIPGYGAFIVPQMSAPFRYSGAQYYERNEHERYMKLAEQTGMYLDSGCGIDTTIYKDDWKHTAPIVEIVTCEFPRIVETVRPQPTPITAVTKQLGLFEPAA
jgi:hypothetical protein